MRDILINNQKVELPFILERDFLGVKYLVSFDDMNEADANTKMFILIELNDGYIYKMGKKEFEEFLNHDGVSIKKLNNYDILKGVK